MPIVNFITFRFNFTILRVTFIQVRIKIFNLISYTYRVNLTTFCVNFIEFGVKH